jgi:hypothetical protein
MDKNALVQATPVKRDKLVQVQPTVKKQVDRFDSNGSFIRITRATK